MKKHDFILALEFPEPFLGKSSKWKTRRILDCIQEIKTVVFLVVIFQMCEISIPPFSPVSMTEGYDDAKRTLIHLNDTQSKKIGLQCQLGYNI